MYQKNTISWLFFGFILFLTTVTYAEEPHTVKVEASKEFLELIKTWDEKIWFFTPQDNPIRSLKGLARNDIACWGTEHFERMKALFNVLGIEGEGVRVLGDGSYNDGDKPVLYITWSNNAPNLQGASRVEFIDAK